MAHRGARQLCDPASGRAASPKAECHRERYHGLRPGSSFLGSDMRAAYYGGTSLTGSGQSLGLVEYYGTDLADLNTYFSNIGQTNRVPVTLLSTDRTSTSCFYPVCDDTEQTLDMTQALGMAPGLSNLVVYVGSSDAAIFNAMATASPLDAQLSSSWTWTPPDPNVDNPYFQEFAAQGQSLFQASGDSGAWGSGSAIYPADDPYVTSVGGTSFAAPMWAGYLALVNQQSVANGNKTAGFINPSLYAIGGGSSYSSSFHDINGGSNGYSATNGYDLATGWGSPNGAGLINALAGSSSNPSFGLSASPSSVTVTQGSSGTSTITSSVMGGFNSGISLSATGQPTGVMVGFSPTSITGAGTSTMTFTVAASVAAGTYSITVRGTSGNTTKTTAVTLTVNATSQPNFNVSASPSNVTVTQGTSATSGITITAQNGFAGTVSFAASGVPSGAGATFNPTAVTGSGTSTMTLTTSTSTPTGTYTITIDASSTSPSLSHTTTVTLLVNSAGSQSFSISTSPSSQTVTADHPTRYTTTVTPSRAFTLTRAC